MKGRQSKSKGKLTRTLFQRSYRRLCHACIGVLTRPHGRFSDAVERWNSKKKYCGCCCAGKKKETPRLRNHNVAFTLCMSLFQLLLGCSLQHQLAVERADAGVIYSRDLWGAPAVALRFTGAIGLIPGLD